MGREVITEQPSLPRLYICVLVMVRVFEIWLNFISKVDEIKVRHCALSSSSFWWGSIRSWSYVGKRLWPVSVSVWMKPEKKSSTQLGFSKKKQEEKPQRQRATHSVYPAVKQRGINLSVSTGEEDTRWTSWMCVTGTHGQRELKSGAFEIQLLRQKGNFCLNTAAITLENEGFPLPFDLSKLISFSCVKKRKKTANNAQMHCRMRHLLMTFEIRHA